MYSAKFSAFQCWPSFQRLISGENKLLLFLGECPADVVIFALGCNISKTLVPRGDWGSQLFKMNITNIMIIPWWSPAYESVRPYYLSKFYKSHVMGQSSLPSYIVICFHLQDLVLLACDHFPLCPMKKLTFLCCLYSIVQGMWQLLWPQITIMPPYFTDLQPLCSAVTCLGIVGICK